MSSGSAPARAVWAAVLLAVAGLGVSAAFDGLLAPVLVVLAVALAFGVVLGGVRLGFGAATSALLVIVVAAGVAGTVLGGVGGDALPRLLTSARPVPVTAQLLTPVVVAVVLLSALVASVVVGPSSSSPSRLIVPVVGAALLYTATLVLSAGASDRHGIVACCLLVVAAAGWSAPVVRGSGVSWRPAAVVPMAVAVVLALSSAVLVGGRAFDPARHVTPPTVRLTATSPLSLLSSWEADPSVEILRASVTGTRRLHLATLPVFTGATWEVDGRYREVGLATSPDLPQGRARSSVHGVVSLTRLGSIWLPAAGTASAASLPDAVVDGDDGTLARASGARSGLRYSFEASVDSPSTAMVRTAPVASSVPARYLALPNAPAAFATYAHKAVRGASTALEEAFAIEHAVSTDRTVSTRAPSGSSYQRLSTFLFGDAGVSGAQEGSAEQFAGAFAVLAREVGLPTRLVVGLDVPTPNSSGTSVVHGSNATAWPEVYFAGAGWVAFAPTPGSAGGSGSAERKTVLQKVANNAAAAAAATPSAAPGVSPAPVRHDPASGARPGAGGVSSWLAAVLIAAAVLVLLGLVSVLLRSRRTARHRRGGACGAWAELADALLLAGRTHPASVPASDVAAQLDRAHPGSGVRASSVAAAAEREAFGPSGAGLAGGSGLADGAVWRDVRVLRRRVRATVPLRRRVLWPVDPRPLRRR